MTRSPSPEKDFGKSLDKWANAYSYGMAQRIFDEEHRLKSRRPPLRDNFLLDSVNRWIHHEDGDRKPKLILLGYHEYRYVLDTPRELHDIIVTGEDGQRYQMKGFNGVPVVCNAFHCWHGGCLEAIGMAIDSIQWKAEIQKDKWKADYPQYLANKIISSINADGHWLGMFFAENAELDITHPNLDLLQKHLEVICAVTEYDA